VGLLDVKMEDHGLRLRMQLQPQAGVPRTELLPLSVLPSGGSRDRQNRAYAQHSPSQEVPNPGNGEDCKNEEGLPHLRKYEVRL
jgi:hypothetical protein